MSNEHIIEEKLERDLFYINNMVDIVEKSEDEGINVDALKEEIEKRIHRVNLEE